MADREKAVSTHNLEDHPDYVQSIGMVGLEAIAMELRLALLLARMLMIPIRTAQAIYLTPKSEEARLDIFQNIAHAALYVRPSRKESGLGKQKTKALKQTLAIIGRARNLIRKRHRVVHDEWNYSDTEKTVTRKLIDGQIGRLPVGIPKTELDDLIYEMRLLIDDAYDLAEVFRNRPPMLVSMRLSRLDIDGGALSAAAKKSTTKSG